MYLNSHLPCKEFSRKFIVLKCVFRCSRFTFLNMMRDLLSYTGAVIWVVTCRIFIRLGFTRFSIRLGCFLRVWIKIKLLLSMKNWSILSADIFVSWIVVIVLMGKVNYNPCNGTDGIFNGFPTFWPNELMGYMIFFSQYSVFSSKHTNWCTLTFLEPLWKYLFMYFS